MKHILFLKKSYAALVASGTATLETALLNKILLFAINLAGCLKIVNNC